MSTGLRSVPLAFDAVDWQFSSRGRFLLVEDPRGLRQVYHPWHPSTDGDFGALTARVQAPADWRGPVFLSVYASDTYVAEGWERVKSTWTHTYAACHQMSGHRYKQVLVDGQVVWERDVGDPEEGAYLAVDLSPHVVPGQAFDLTLRVFDRVSSATPLPGDEFRLGIWSWQGLADPQASGKLYTRVFWGDVALGEGGPIPWETNPARPALTLCPVEPAPILPAPRREGRLIVDAPAGLPADGFPVTWGVPFSQGELRDGDQVALAGPDGSLLPLQTAVLHRWPDHSVHWLLLDFSAPAEVAGTPLSLVYGSRVTPAVQAPGLRVEATDSSVTVDTGALRFVVRRGQEALLEDLTLAGDSLALGRRLDAQVTVRDGWVHTRYAAIGDHLELEAAGPERATVLVSGRLLAEDRTFGRFTLRIHAYRQRPYLRLYYRIFNDTDLPAQLVEELVVRLATSLTDGQAMLGDQALTTGPAEVDRLLVRQHRHDAYEVFAGDDARRGSGAHWELPVTLMGQDEGVTGQVRHFAQLYPKRMWAGSGGQVVFDLFTRTQDNEQYVMTRGEALRHELLLYFHRGRPDPSVAAAFRRPPILTSPEWYADHQALGRGAPLTPETFPALSRWMLEPWTPDLSCVVPLGLRNWPDHYSDSIYNAYRGTWSNLYQEVDYGAHLLGLLSGRRAWFDYAEAYQRHFMDLDVCHYHPDSTYTGAAYGIAPYHTGSEPYALNAPLAGLFLLHYLTGDPDAREAAVGIAGWLHARHLGVGATSGRAVGWPLRSAAIAYENTGDQRYLSAARRLAGYALASLEPRRGFFSEPQATWQYRGGSPGMNAILAAGLMRYWRVTGDPQAGRACADLAYNMAYGWMSPTEPGLILGADPLQQVYVTGYALQDIAPLFWGYELTGDERLLAKGVEVMRASILAEDQRGAAFGLSRYWEMQDVLYYYGLALRRGLDRER
ncbi:MAG: hypothetical protein WDA75_08835 [Candidatus Latescibacterota bacterium]